MGERTGEVKGPVLGHEAEGGECDGAGGPWCGLRGRLPVGMTQELGSIRAGIRWTVLGRARLRLGPLPLWLPFQRGDRSFGKAARDRRSQRFSGRALTPRRAPVGWRAGWQGSARLLRSPRRVPSVGILPHGLPLGHCPRGRGVVRLEFHGPCQSALLCPVLWCVQPAAPPACANHGIFQEYPRRAEAGGSQCESFLPSPILFPQRPARPWGTRAGCPTGARRPAHHPLLSPQALPLGGDGGE